MYVAFSQVRVGAPVRYQTLSVFPLFDGSMTAVEYTLSDEGIGSGAVSVGEVSEAGSVPDLLVENKGDVRVLFREGEELVGAKQNRVLNTSVLIAAPSKTKIPVTCVEQGRWRYRSKRLGSRGSHSSSKLRYFLKRSVTQSVMAKRGHRADQGKVWEEVARQQSALGTSSRTSAMADTFQTHQGNVAEFREKLQYVDGACGLAVAIGKKVDVGHVDRMRLGEGYPVLGLGRVILHDRVLDESDLTVPAHLLEEAARVTGRDPERLPICGIDDPLLDLPH